MVYQVNADTERHTNATHLNSKPSSSIPMFNISAALNLRYKILSYTTQSQDVGICAFKNIVPVQKMHWCIPLHWEMYTRFQDHVNFTVKLQT